MDRMSDVLGRASTRIESWRYIIVIRNAFQHLIPVVIVGAFATLFKTMVFDPSMGLAQFEWAAFLATFKPIADGVAYATLKVLTIYAVFLIGLEVSKINEVKGYFAGIVAVMSYIALTPTIMEAVSGDLTVPVSNVIASKYTDANGLFIGIVVSIAASELWCFLGRQDALRIKMPPSVPANVSASFSALIPTIITVVVFSVVCFVVKSLTGMYPYDIVYSVITVPLLGLSQGLPTVLLLQLIAQVFWVFGIHGNSLISAIYNPLMIPAITANTEAFAAGEPIPNIFSDSFECMYMKVGGSGMLLCLAIAIFIVARRKDFREIAKLSLPCNLFNIGEVVIFGLPIVLNPILAIPFVIVSLVTGCIGYFATVIGFAAPAVFLVPWPTPPIINALIATSGNIGAVITQLICIVVGVLIYLPFVKAMDRHADADADSAAQLEED
ncbi:PTS sugar transporter subunit IIC [Olsenella sp. SW781]|nr:PTS sugar transporter subunit IIC [Olsenella sp. SW781]